MAEELKPCPFCGGAVRHEEWHVGDSSKALYRPWCEDINCPSGDYNGDTPDDLAAYWNHRPIEDALETENERLRDALERVDTWSRAYPVSVFPEPDFKRVHELLKAGGISLDSVSASNMRRVVKGVGEIARDALSPTIRKDGNA